MRFIQIINSKKFTLATIFLFLYLALNLFDGERGLISYYEKHKIKNQLLEDKYMLASELLVIENKNNLLTKTIDLDFLETLYRKMFMVGKSNEQIYKND